MYNEALDDPKVQDLSGNDFKAWVNMLMLASRHDGNIPKIEHIAFALRVTKSEAQKVMGRLYDAGLIDYVDGVARPHAWDARQYKSDTSAERMRRHRKRHRDVTGDGPDTETELEEEKRLGVVSLNGRRHAFAEKESNRG